VRKIPALLEEAMAMAEPEPGEESPEQMSLF